MLARITCATLVGVDAALVQVEVDVSPGLPNLSIVGLPDVGVRESRDRVRSAVRNSGFDYPLGRITVNLAPAGFRKVGAAFDLPIALGVLAASGQVTFEADLPYLVAGELGLDGRVIPVRGVLPMALAAWRHGLRGVMVPEPNSGEATLVEQLRVLPVRTLVDAAHIARTPERCPPHRTSPVPSSSIDHPDLADVKHQAVAKRALEIAAAGGHHLLLVGPPGAGKTMLARRLPGLLPHWSFAEAVESTCVHSVAGVLPTGSQMLPSRPFRAPHHTASAPAMVGGGGHPRPGEISLAHNGVLFLDELLEFERRVLEVLRQPLEEGRIVITRAAQAVTFPAKFQLVAAMNPCPCGRLGDPRQACRCTPYQVAAYRCRLSGPLRDRLDLVVPVHALSVRELHDESRVLSEPRSSVVRQRIETARIVQVRRAAVAGVTINADLDGRGLRETCALDGPSREAMSRAAENQALSARAYTRVLRVARTIADLAGATSIELPHVLEALQYRSEPYATAR